MRPGILEEACRGMRGRVSPAAKALIAVGMAVNLWGVLGTRWGWVGM